MRIVPRPPALVAALLVALPLLPATVLVARAVADDEPPVPPRVEVFEMIDRKKTMSMKLPRAWKDVGEKGDPAAILEYGGFFGEPEKSDNGFVAFFVASQYARAAMARAVEMPRYGTQKPASARQGPGWMEACATTEQHQAVWRRYVEKNNRVYAFQVLAHESAYDRVKSVVEKFLDSATVPGEYAPPSFGPGWNSKKSGEFDVLTDAEAGREKLIAKVIGLLSTSREIVAKSLPGKPFDAGKAGAWIFQNGNKYEDHGKAVSGVEVKANAIFASSDRATLVKMLGDGTVGFDDDIYFAGAAQYVWQYFGGEVPIWLATGMGQYGRFIALGGGKGKLPADVTNKTKAAVAAGKRRLDQWFDLTNWADVTDNDQGQFELFGWQWYFRNGHGAKKFKKQFDGYIQSLRDTGDPAVARKAFDGVNFDDMLADFKASAAEMK